MDTLGYKIWKKSCSGKRVERLIKEQGKNSLKGFRESEEGQRILALNGNSEDTPYGIIISKMQEEQPSLYEALTMWFDPKMQGVTNEDIVSWFNYKYDEKTDTYDYEVASCEKALINLSGKAGDLDMYSFTPNDKIPLPTILEDGRIRMSDGKCSLAADILVKKSDIDTVFWYMDYIPSQEYIESSSTGTLIFYPWCINQSLYVTTYNENSALTGINNGLSITYSRSAYRQNDYVYQFARSYGWHNTVAPNTITISNTTSESLLEYVKANMPNRPCWSTRHKVNSEDFNYRKFSCYYGNDERNEYDKSIAKYSTDRVANDVNSNFKGQLWICDRRSDYNFAEDAYRPPSDCVFGWFISFNRPLTDEEIAWVEDNMYSTKLEDIPYRPFEI